MNERVFASSLGIEPEEVYPWNMSLPGEILLLLIRIFPHRPDTMTLATGIQLTGDSRAVRSYSLFLNQVSSIKDYQTETVR